MSHPILDELHRRAEGRPIYLACAPSVAPWVSDEITNLLCRKRPGITIVNGCGLYGSNAAWRTRWAKERDRYGGMIVLSVAELLADGEPETGGGIKGAHILGEYGVEELTDLLKLGRPVAWLACFGGHRRLVSRFSVEPPTWSAMNHWARLFRSADAQPFVPVIGDLSFFVPVAISSLATIPPTRS
jgi:hypothetical protein